MDLDHSSNVVDNILNPTGSPRIFTVSLSTFKEIFYRIHDLKEDLKLDIVLNGNWAMAQFSNLSKHRIRIFRYKFENKPLGNLLQPKPRGRITAKDFEYASLVASFHGSQAALTFPQFLWEELTSNFGYLLLTFLLAFFTLSFTSTLPEDTYINLIKSLNELLISVATLYLSIFILFTVSQNASIIEDEMIFRQGLTHRFFKIDRFLAILVIVAIILCLATYVINELEPSINMQILGRTIHISKISTITTISTSLSVTILVNCFLSVVRYYFKRTRHIFERDLTKAVLDKAIIEKESE